MDSFAVDYVRTPDGSLIPASSADPIHCDSYRCGGCNAPVHYCRAHDRSNGSRVRAHFRHTRASGDAPPTSCSAESILHKYAKHLIATRRPRIQARLFCGHTFDWDWPMGCTVEEEMLVPDTHRWLDVGVRSPDGTITGIEVMVTHKVDAGKACDLKDASVSWMEVAAADVVALFDQPIESQPKATIRDYFDRKAVQKTHLKTLRAVSWDGCGECRVAVSDKIVEMSRVAYSNAVRTAQMELNKLQSTLDKLRDLEDIREEFDKGVRSLGLDPTTASEADINSAIESRIVNRQESRRMQLVAEMSDDDETSILDFGRWKGCTLKQLLENGHVAYIFYIAGHVGSYREMVSLDLKAEAKKLIRDNAICHSCFQLHSVKDTSWQTECFLCYKKGHKH